MYRTLCLLCKCTGLPQKKWMLTGAILIWMIRKVVLVQRENTFTEEIIQTTTPASVKINLSRTQTFLKQVSPV